MLISMTGYGRASAEYKGKKIIIDIRTLNSKSIDISIRIPNYYKEKEMELRKLLANELQRGKVDFCMFVELGENESSNKFNEELIINYYSQLKTLCENNNIPVGNELINSIIKMPDVTVNEFEELEENEWVNILEAVNKALLDCNNFRKHEGEILKNDIVGNLNSILNLLAQVPQYENERIDTVKDRLNQSLAEIAVSSNFDENRFEQEIIYYLEKLDINEEKVRLKKHCEYFIETINLEDYAGKKLGFVSQEIGREINTLGSKAHHVEIQKLVIMMKDELEKIKEQLLNAL